MIQKVDIHLQHIYLSPIQTDSHEVMEHYLSHQRMEMDPIMEKMLHHLTRKERLAKRMFLLVLRLLCMMMLRHRLMVLFQIQKIRNCMMLRHGMNRILDMVVLLILIQPILKQQKGLQYIQRIMFACQNVVM